MRVQVVKMRSAGVEVPKRMLNDRYTVTYQGDLVLMDVTDQGLRRPVRVARLVQAYRGSEPLELVDPHILWISDNRFVLAGFESLLNAAGIRVDYAQSWLCSLDEESQAPAVPDAPKRVKI